MINVKIKIRKKLWKKLNKRMILIEETGNICFVDEVLYKLWITLSKKLLKRKLIKTNSELEQKLKKMFFYKKNKTMLFYSFDKRLDEINKRVLEVNKQLKVMIESPKSVQQPKDIYSSVYSALPYPMHKKFVACQGFYYSGSSTLIGLFREFDNTTVLGYPDNVYSASKVQNSIKEIRFFRDSHLFSLIEAFDSEKALEKDLVIKQFITDVYTCYEKKGLFSWDKDPNLYNEYFLRNSLIFLSQILDLDDYTIGCMKDKKFPCVHPKDSQFSNCCFTFDQDEQQYIFYKFKKISRPEFEKYVSDYISNFFRSISCKDVLICDQIFGHKYLDKYNKYAIIPAKQICVYRDPRDQFLSAFRQDIRILPRDIEHFISFYKMSNGLENMLKNPNPNRLMIRFEDLVLKYNETVRKILNFVEIDPSHHIAPKSIFDPKISVMNIGAYKRFIDQNFMKEIEEALPEYCYYPEKENLSKDAKVLLKGILND